MIFCGQCGYQLAPEDTVCPRCGAKAEANPQAIDTQAYHPTEVSHAVLDLPPPPQPRVSQPVQSVTPDSVGPLVLGPSGAGYPDVQLANAQTSMMSSQMYAPQQQPSYPGYQQQMGSGPYGYNPGYQQYQAAQANAQAQLLASSRRGKTTSLLLILFGLLLLIGAVVVFLLTTQGFVF